MLYSKVLSFTTLLRFAGSHIASFYLRIEEEFLMIKSILTIHYTFYNTGYKETNAFTHNKTDVLCTCTHRHTDIFLLLYIGLCPLKGTFCSQYFVSVWYMLSVNVSIDFSSLMWNVAFIVCICVCVASSSVYFFSSACRHKCSTVQCFLYLIWILLILSLICYQKNL